jgi:hypothetical protein
MLCYEKIRETVSKNILLINTEKTVAMFFHSNQFRLPNKPRAVFNNTEIVFKPEVRLLGIYISENLNLNVHGGSLRSSLSNVSYIIESEAVLSPCLLRSIYFAYFPSCFKYGIIFWGGDSESKTAFIVQKRVIRIISGANNCKSCRTIFKEYRGLTLTYIYI